jgi:hypothetical protein
MIALRNLWRLLMFVVVLVGCGRTSETTLAPQQSGQAVSPTPINWPVWNATQEAIRQKVEQHELFMDQTAVVIPTAPIGVDPSPGPPSVLDTGWLIHCGSQLSPRLFRGYDSNNCFRLQRDNLYVTLFAGGVVADPAQGELIVVTHTLDMRKSRSVPYYTPQQNGPIQLNTIEYPLAYVSTGTLTTTFNLETRQWGTENGSPIPASTAEGK